MLFQIPTTLPSPLTLLIILYPQKATSTATEIFLSEQLQIQKPKKNVYTRDIPLPFSHRSRPSCPPKKNCVTFGFHKYIGWSFLFPIFVKASTTYTYFRKAEAERCFCIILIVIQILFIFWYIPFFFIKYSQFQSIFLEHFIERNLLFFEKCI